MKTRARGGCTRRDEALGQCQVPSAANLMTMISTLSTVVENINRAPANPWTPTLLITH